MLLLGAGAAGAWASPADPKVNVDYQVLSEAQPTSSGKKVEVTEFFSYRCPRSYAFEPGLEQWVKAQGDSIVLVRVPVAFRPDEAPLQKLYYTLEALGKADELHAKVFKAIHAERKGLWTDKAIADYAAEQGIDRQKFLDVYNSFRVQAKQRRAAQLSSAYKVAFRPLVAIEGRYETAPDMLAAQMKDKPESEKMSAALKVMSYLVKKSVKR